MAEQGRDHLPLSDVVLCSTSLPQEARIRLADVAQQMGAKHVLDLTGEVTHLIVGDSDTPKYKYVAKERPDIIVLDPAWIDAVREVWIDGGDVDVQGLERIHRCPTFVGLKICITGFPDQAQRNHLSATIEHEGAEYHGDLTKQITHLIVAQPGSAKYKAAQDWRINTVSMKWLEDSAARGMALDPRYYDPTMPYQEQGKGAYRKEGGLPTSLGKRLRNEESQTSAASAGGKRKLRRHASRRLEDHSQDMWQDISAADATTVAPSEATDQWTAGDEDSQLTAGRAAAHPQVKQSFDIRQDQTVAIAPKQEGIFSGWCIATEGFEKEKTMRLAQYLEPNGAHIVKGLQDLYSMREEQHETRCLLVPHAQTDPTAHILQPGGGIVVATEWWVERCIHYKQVLDPKQDALSQPLFNILGFSKLTISTTGFSGVDYRQVAEAVKLAGATYQEQLTPTISVLISGTPTVKKEKAYYAAKHQISVVTAEWLWTSLRQKRKTSMDRFKIELPKYDPNNATGSASAAPSPAPSEISKRSAETGSKKDNQALSRLSHTRKRQATPSLPLQALKPASKSSKPAGPFVHEDDDDNDDDNEHDDDDYAAPVEGESLSTTHETFAKVVPLQAISPNASPRKQPSIDQQKVTPPTEDHNISDVSNPDEHFEILGETKEAPLSPIDEPSAKSEAQSLSARPEAAWTADLASIMQRQQRRTTSSEHQTTAQRLKHRKLGRAASGSSLASRTNTGSTNANQDTRHGDASFSDSPESLAPAQENLPSTQVGYETLEAEAARMQMAKRMGTSYSDESSGTRLASLGTVKDSAAPANATGGRARNRTRK